MKRYYIITLVMFLLLALFYVYGLTIERDNQTVYSVAAEEGNGMP